MIPEDGESQTVHFNASTDKYDCEPHGLKIPIRDWERKQAGEKGFALMRNGKLNTLLSTQLVNREYKGWAKIRAAVTAASGKGAWSGTAGADKDPVDELDALIEKINNDTGLHAGIYGLGAVRLARIQKSPQGAVPPVRH